MDISLEDIATQALNFIKANNIEVYKGLLAANEQSNFITSYWDEEEDSNVESFLSIAIKNNVNLIYISKDVYRKQEFEELRELYQGMLHNKKTDKDIKLSIQDQLTKLDDLDSYDGLMKSLEISFPIGNVIHSYLITTEWNDLYNEMREELDSLDEEDDEDEDDD